jgi:hypothetical protein
MKSPIASSVVLAVCLSSCATQSDKARSEGSTVGAGAGAATGAAIGAILGRNRKSALIGAALGALVGAISGYVYADQIAKRHEELAGKENDLDARIAFARGVNEDTRDYNARLQQEVRDLAPKVAELAAKKKRQEITGQELAREKQALSTKISIANNQLTVGQKELQELKRFRSGQKKTSEALDAEIKALEQNLAQMKTNTTALASLNQRI